MLLKEKLGLFVEFLAEIHAIYGDYTYGLESLACRQVDARQARYSERVRSVMDNPKYEPIKIRNQFDSYGAMRFCVDNLYEDSLFNGPNRHPTLGWFHASSSLEIRLDPDWLFNEDEVAVFCNLTLKTGERFALSTNVAFKVKDWLPSLRGSGEYWYGFPKHSKTPTTLVQRFGKDVVFFDPDRNPFMLTLEYMLILARYLEGIVE